MGLDIVPRNAQKGAVDLEAFNILTDFCLINNSSHIKLNLLNFKYSPFLFIQKYMFVILVKVYLVARKRNAITKRKFM